MHKKFIEIIYEDIGYEDITSNALIPQDMLVKGKIIAREEGLLSGMDVIISIFYDFSVKTCFHRNDGDKVQPGDVILEIEGNARDILSVERTVLNLLMRLSGIATVTNELLVKIRKVNPDIILAGTRKTTPGLQFLEKQAIRVGGGDTHRYRLDDSVLIKDNHLALVGNIKKAISMARNYVSFTTKIEVEAETKKQALDAAEAGADIIMLDNMLPDEVSDVLSLLKSLDLDKKIIIEVSGGINPKNIEAYASTGVDVISTGYITHSVTSLDMSLELDQI
jgi:nicotinate-nucleotide pyrophosphorylase (carboxylating)